MTLMTLCSNHSSVSCSAIITKAFPFLLQEIGTTIETHGKTTDRELETLEYSVWFEISPSNPSRQESGDLRRRSRKDGMPDEMEDTKKTRPYAQQYLCSYKLRSTEAAYTGSAWVWPSLGCRVGRRRRHAHLSLIRKLSPTNSHLQVKS